jgi:hypothetical protein
MKKIALVLCGMLFFASCNNTTTLHLPERKEAFKIYNYKIDDGCISFQRDPKSNKGETICNEKFWIETTTNDD